MKKLFAVLLILVMACSVLAACGDSGSSDSADAGGADSIVGQWASQDYDGAFVFTFNEDGTGNYDASGTDMPFTYTIDGDQLSILYDGDTISFDTPFTISGTTLTIKDSMDEDVVYNKL